MHVERHRWESPNTGLPMPVVQFGHAGVPLIYLPSSGGDEREFEQFGMPDELSTWLAAGKIRLFCADARGPHTLFDRRLAPRERIRTYAQVERYVAHELLPWVQERTGQARLTVVGASYGAFVAANLLFKHPARVERVCGLGGVYEMWHRLDGYHDDDVYLHTPFEYLPRLEDPEILAEIRATRGIEMYAAADDAWLPQTGRLEAILRMKKLPHATHVWASPAAHHERWWRLQLRDFVTRHF